MFVPEDYDATSMSDILDKAIAHAVFDRDMSLLRTELNLNAPVRVAEARVTELRSKMASAIRNSVRNKGSTEDPDFYENFHPKIATFYKSISAALAVAIPSTPPHSCLTSMMEGVQALDWKLYEKWESKYPLSLQVNRTLLAERATRHGQVPQTRSHLPSPAASSSQWPGQQQDIPTPAETAARAIVEQLQQRSVLDALTAIEPILPYSGHFAFADALEAWRLTAEQYTRYNVSAQKLLDESDRVAQGARGVRAYYSQHATTYRVSDAHFATLITAATFDRPQQQSLSTPPVQQTTAPVTYPAPAAASYGHPHTPQWTGGPSVGGPSQYPFSQSAAPQSSQNPVSNRYSEPFATESPQPAQYPSFPQQATNPYDSPQPQTPYGLPSPVNYTAPPAPYTSSLARALAPPTSVPPPTNPPQIQQVNSPYPTQGPGAPPQRYRTLG